jgi:glycine/D-amino acid oxidase-like deaminating enzyme
MHVHYGGQNEGAKMNIEFFLFFMAFLPQFVPLEAAGATPVLIGLAAIFMALTFVVFVAYTPDGPTLLGQVPGIDGFFAAAGCCGNGIALSGGIGKAMCDLVKGDEPGFDISAFDPGRFGSVDPYDGEFQEQCAAARSAKTLQ